jgi:hypothetical protein
VAGLDRQYYPSGNRRRTTDLALARELLEMSKHVSEQVIRYSKAIQHMLEQRAGAHENERAKERARLRDTDYIEYKGGCV